MPPNFWAKAFADALSISGNFQSIRFFYSPSELTNEEYFIEGTVAKANFTHVVDRISEFTLSFQAWQRANNRLIWEKEVTRPWKLQGGVEYQEQINQVIQAMFAEAREDLVRVLVAHPGSRAGNVSLPSDVSPAPQPSAESVDETIEDILKGK